eukprot:GEMP01033707.1.p1 GENE.GEMP01033707.1~~GEMP01033707.1.p1  ORF type:complete len:413 (+),score=38.06 GEMP01033707.1:145-1383(+)
MRSTSSRFTLSGQGQSQTQECAFHAGTIWSAPIKVSYFLVILYVYNLIESVRLSGQLPIWYVFFSETLKQLVLLATILCHEFGHGTMATYLGGKIEHILLWPFGGICFSRRSDQELDNRKKLFNELKVVCAGPITHFFQAPFWLAVFIGVRHAIPQADFGSPSWVFLIPFSQPMSPTWCPPGYHAEFCISSLGQWMLFDVVRFALVMNVMLFMFNVFFPMYPLDGAKIISCTLMLCGLSAIMAAKFLIFTSIPLVGYLIYSAFSSAQTRGGVATGIMAYLGFMCLMETYRIYDLLTKRQLHLHPLFETARSSTYAASDNTYRLNTSTREDVTSTRDDVARNETYRPVFVPTSFQPFSTEGQTLVEPGAANNENPREAFLDRLEQKQVQSNLTVWELQQQRRDPNARDDDGNV